MNVLLLLSKIFHQAICDQRCQYPQIYRDSLLRGFQKAHFSQHVLFNLRQAWQEESDKSGFKRKMLMDSSKAYSCQPHDLLIRKFETYVIEKMDSV